MIEETRRAELMLKAWSVEAEEIFRLLAMERVPLTARKKLDNEWEVDGSKIEALLRYLNQLLEAGNEWHLSAWYNKAHCRNSTPGKSRVFGRLVAKGDLNVAGS
jgi:hypothetical protein